MVQQNVRERAKRKRAVYSQGKFDPKHPLITQSFLKMFETCAFAAYLRYVEGRTDPPNGHATVGLAVDAAITYGAECVIATGRDATEAEKLEVAADAFDRRTAETRFCSDLGKPRARELALDLVSLHHDQVAPQLRPVETQVSIRVDFNDYSIAGKLDLVEEGHIISDHKTAKAKGRHKVALRAQPALYSLLYMHRFGVRPTAFRHYVLLKTKRLAIEPVPLGRVTAHDQSVLDYRIRAAISEFQNSLQSGYWRLAKEDDWKCHASGKWCSYLYSGCPKGKKISKGVSNG